jgi:DNA end-binding protein Ku
MRNKAYVGALQLYRGYPMLMSLHHAEEVIPVEALEPPQGPPLDLRELGLARQLIEMLEAEFQPQDYRDEFRHRVLAMVEAKASGKKVQTLAPRRLERGGDIRHALETSLKQARKRA